MSEDVTNCDESINKKNNAQRPWWYIGLIRTENDPPLTLIVNWVCIGLMACGVYIASNTYTAFRGWKPPKYDELVVVNGVIEFKSHSKSYSIVVKDVATSIPYYIVVGYKNIKNDVGKKVQALGSNNRIYELKLNNKKMIFYDEYVKFAYSKLKTGGILFIAGIVIYIIFLLKLKLKLNRKWQKREVKAGSALENGNLE